MVSSWSMLARVLVRSRRCATIVWSACVLSLCPRVFDRRMSSFPSQMACSRRSGAYALEL
jgi:hypothetical protein